jgi:signal peptidase II
LTTAQPGVGAAARALALAGIVVALDQGSKAAASSFIDRGDTINVIPGLKLADVRNSGIAFGLFGGASSVLIGVTIVALIGVLVYLAAGSTGPRVWVSSGLLLGGALGNLADRVRIDSVIDFIDVPAWPTFNLADAAIVAGVFCLVLIPDSPKDARRE